MAKSVLKEPIFNKLQDIVEWNAQQFFLKRMKERKSPMPLENDVAFLDNLVAIWTMLYSEYEPLVLGEISGRPDSGYDIPFEGRIFENGSWKRFYQSGDLNSLHRLKKRDPQYVRDLKDFIRIRKSVFPVYVIQSLIIRPKQDTEGYDQIVFTFQIPEGLPLERATPLEEVDSSTRPDFYRMRYDLHAERVFGEDPKIPARTMLRCLFALGLMPLLVEAGMLHAPDGYMEPLISAAKAKHGKNLPLRDLWAKMRRALQGLLLDYADAQVFVLHMLEAFRFIPKNTEISTIGKALEELRTLQKQRFESRRKLGVELCNAVPVRSLLDPPPSKSLPYPDELNFS